MVANKGLPRIMVSERVLSMIMKSERNKNLFILIRTFSTIPKGTFLDISAISQSIFVFLRLVVQLIHQSSQSIIAATTSNLPTCLFVVPFLGMVSHNLNCCESLGWCHPRNWSLRIKQLMVHSAQTLIEDIYLLMTIDVVSRALLLYGQGKWAVPLDKFLFEEIPSIDSSWASLSTHLFAAPVEFSRDGMPWSPLQLVVEEVILE
ncbi:hypothetical protein Tco_0585451 [Tanacetum coccineum]